MSPAQTGVAAHGGENTAFIVLISCVATLGGFLFGFDSGVINGTVDGLRQAFNSSEAALGFEVASMLLGCAIGAFVAGRLGDLLGRRSVLIISAVLFLLSALGAGAAHASWMFVAARMVGGFAVGAASVMSPAYIAEVASARYRGKLATVQQMAIISGLFAAFLSNSLLWPVPPVPPPRCCGWGRRHGAGCSGCRRFRRCCSCCCCWRSRKVRASWSPRGARRRPRRCW